jgi:hypothetical protein
MDPRILLGHAVKIAIVIALVGLYRTGRSRRCLSVVAYLWVALLGNSLTTFWPEIFFEARFWSRRQALFDLLKLAMGLEVAWRAFAAFPGARATWDRLLAVSIVAGSSAAFLAVPRPPAYSVIFDLQPRIVAGTVWLFTITALIVVYYRIPLDDWHRAILLGLAPYQVVFTWLITSLHRPAWPLVGFLEQVAYLAMIAWWARCAWRHEESLDEVSVETRRLLRLERA